MVVVLALGVVVLIIQMVALGLLGNQRGVLLVPWEREGQDYSVKVEQRTPNPHLELHNVSGFSLVFSLVCCSMPSLFP